MQELQKVLHQVHPCIQITIEKYFFLIADELDQVKFVPAELIQIFYFEFENEEP